jgi:hypothetical protein
VTPTVGFSATLNEPVVLAKFLGGPADDMLVFANATPSVDIIPAVPGPPLNLAFQSSPLATPSGRAVVTLTLPAATAETVSLSSSDPAITMPSSISFGAGTQQQSFDFTLNQGYDSTHLLALSATDNSGYTATAFVQKPNPTTIAAVIASVDDSNALLVNGQLTVVPGQVSAFDLHLMSKGGYQGTFGGFTCGGLPPGASCSFAGASAQVASDSPGDIDFTVDTSSNTPQGRYTVTIWATDGALVTSAQLPLIIGDFSFGVSTTTLVYGNGTPPTETITPSMPEQHEMLPPAYRLSKQPFPLNKDDALFKRIAYREQIGRRSYAKSQISMTGYSFGEGQLRAIGSKSRVKPIS